MPEEKVTIIVTGWTDRVGSKTSEEVVIDKEEWDEMCEKEREAHLYEEALKMFDWDWKIEE